MACRKDFEYGCECGYYLCYVCGKPSYPMESEETDGGVRECPFCGEALGQRIVESPLVGAIEGELLTCEEMLSDGFDYYGGQARDVSRFIVKAITPFIDHGNRAAARSGWDSCLNALKDFPGVYINEACFDWLEENREAYQKEGQSR